MLCWREFDMGWTDGILLLGEFDCFVIGCLVVGSSLLGTNVPLEDVGVSGSRFEGGVLSS